MLLLNVPRINVMSQFSYWLYGLKVSFIKQMYDKIYIEENLQYLWKNTVNMTMTDNAIIDAILTNQWIDTLLLHDYLLWWIQRTQWNEYTAWHYLTLFNIWWFWQPHWNPQMWWSYLEFAWMNFGNLWEILFYSMDVMFLSKQL